MPKKPKGEEEGQRAESGTGRWMLTYLDMVTLLFGVFVIMYAMSNVDKAKAERVAESIRAGFRGGLTIFGGPLTGGQTIMNNLDPVGTMKKSLYDVVRKATRKELEHRLVTVTETERGVRISLVGDIYFESGSAHLLADTVETLSRIAPILREVDNPVVIAGHTDDVPVHQRKKEAREFTDNWELGALRAINVLRYFEEHGVQPSKMSVQSHAMYQPLGGDKKFPGRDTPEYRAVNRRVDIIIETGKKLNQKNEW
jgi:chemotaxis protein MotB